ncbi:hypothetical protein NVV94_08235 [Pseudomonas sp. LS1212]|uniref:hypothetical protein n=1 Tax=Pseudomonas sp. LS1212 TaxID=2972478 RepID=UPI00215BFAE9|nr:hypothetical protein [Pseudomonas sp. LS1212]UVJ45531.1 hypothetical protein NVV94_08235 [Pseudomonas sp. LS1212]
MAVSNIEMFDDITGKIFAALYQSFPIPKYLMAESFVDVAMEFDERHGMELPSSNAEFFIATAQWLIDAGYMAGSTHGFIRVEDAVLTAKGLEALKAIPDSVSSKASIGEQLANTAKEEGREAFRGLVGQALGIGARIISPVFGLSS